MMPTDKLRQIAGRERLVPLPGRPCRVRWLEPMPKGWTVRTNGRFFFLVFKDDLRGIFDVFAPRYIMQAGLRDATMLEAQRPAVPEEHEQIVNQAFRIHAHIISLTHGVVRMAVLNGLADAAAAALASGTDPETSARQFQYFIQRLAERYAQMMGGVALFSTQPDPERKRPQGPQH